MEIVQTNEQIKAKAVAALGFSAPDPRDVIHRDDYNSDAEYAVALARMTQTMNTPEYRAAARKVGVMVHKESEKEAADRQRAEFKSICASVTLSVDDQRRIDEEANRRAKAEIGAGKIGASELGDAVVRIAKELTRKAKEEKASSIMFNKQLREDWQKGEE